ncbi:receptor-like protein 7 [Pyrus x bretschneideri]|uniref:receptor-like protein 7 n=1 Tax=Pyrus x bretschneideri TaxID=225117 RepID=UPI00202F78B1|nr:receptor-like protein 7 [Pyrus x bretschneideri]
MGTGLGSSWFSLFFIGCINLLLLNATHCVSFVQTLSHFAECSALFQFKESLTINMSASNDPSAYPKVASWSQEDQVDRNRSNCCSWDGVECYEESGHVIGLDLASSCLYGSITSNSSLFRLVHLQRLDLSDNHFNFSPIPSRLGHELTSLTYLNLSRSSFFGQIPSEISKLSKLSTLDLSYNEKHERGGANHFHLKLTKANLRSLVQNLTNIKQLHLSWVDIYSTVPDILVNASSLTSLELEDSGLYGEFPVGLFHLPNLEVLCVSCNLDLTGYFPNFNRTNSLKKLNVGHSSFSGQLPSSLGNLHSLNLLGIHFCNFYPHVPSSLRNLTKLRYLYISSFYDSMNFPGKSSFTTTNQSLVSESLSWLGKLTKLYHLGLSYTNRRGKFPCFVSNLTNLEYLDLGTNEITGQIPSWVTMNLTQLTVLDLSFNNLRGSVEFDQFSNLKKLKDLRLSNNKLSLRIKSNLSATLPVFQILRLSSCNLTEFPEFLSNQKELYDLHLSYNNIHGQIPKWFWNATTDTLLNVDFSGNLLTGFDQNPLILPWKNMLFFHIASNRLQGPLPVPPQSITAYHVANNDYSGEISPLFCYLDYLQLLDLSNNNLSGMLPQCLGNSSTLEVLYLRNNSFHGNIPQLCANKNSLKMVDLSFNRLQGKLPRTVANCTQLEFLNLGNNRISDSFPSWLGALPVLRALILRHNGFHGIIGKPATTHEFPNLCIIDLSNNDFSGMLPTNYLENWNFMKFVGEANQTYFKVSSIGNPHKIWYEYPYTITIVAKGVELKYLETPYLLRLIDLSSNRFEGEIPAGIIGNLRGLHFLSLSNNSLTGLIPSSLGNLAALESLDLSENQLSGRIPSNLVQLNFLAYFNVSHNRLWGPIPLGQQFDTFLEDSYQENPGLCGKPLSKKCKDSESTKLPPPSILEEGEDSGFRFEFDWYVVLPGVISGLIVGVISGNTLANNKHEWFVEKFSRKRQPRGTKGKGRRT